MKKVSYLSKLIACGVVAVVRGSTPEEAVKSSRALIEGGITGIEITFTTPQADQVIRQLSEEFSARTDVIIGAGTVLDEVTARIAILAGAQFVVSPAFDSSSAACCNLYQIPYLPGCMTITEITTALKAGVDIIKLFPGGTVGMDFIPAIKAPLPHVNIMPTGGVSLENMKDWFQKGAVAVGVGGNLLKPAASGDFEQVCKNAKEYADRYQLIKKELGL